MPTKGKKNQKGQPEKYGEMKKRVNFTLTPTGIAKLEGLASQMQLSKSELIEQVARGDISIQPSALTTMEREIAKKCFSRLLLMQMMS
jgi:hypothetical protein